MAIETAVELRGTLGVMRGIRHPPQPPDSGWSAVILRGYFSATHVGPARLYVQIGRLLAARGVETFRIDPGGSGDSDGESEEMTYASECTDSRLMIDYARASQTPAARKVLIVGHCLGAGTAVRIAAADPTIDRLFLISPACGTPFAPGDPFSSEQREELAATGRTERRGVAIARETVEAMEDPALFEIARTVAAHCVVFHGSADEYFPPCAVQQLASALPGARRVEIAGADHNFLVRRTRPRLFEALDAEIQEWLGTGTVRKS